MNGELAHGWRLTPFAPTSVAVAAERIEAPITTPWSGFFATQTGGIVSLSRPL